MWLARLLALACAALALSCGGGSDSGGDAAAGSPAPSATSAEGNASPEPSATAEDAPLVVERFEANNVGYTVVVTDLTITERSFAASVSLTNDGNRGPIDLELTLSQALLLSESQAEAWRDDFPRAYQEVDIERLVAASAGSAVSLMIESSDALPVQLLAGETWNGSFAYDGPVSSEVTAVVLILGNAGMNGLTDEKLFSFDETKPYIGLYGQAAVVPLPPLEPLSLQPGDKISIAKAGVDQPITLLTVGRDGVMPNPGPSEVALYDFAAFGLGVAGSPKSGNSVISALHSPGGTQGPFFEVLKLEPGDTIELVYQGTTYAYVVAWKCAVPNSNFTEIIRKEDATTLTLLPGIGGPTQYVVRAELVAGSISPQCPDGTSVFSGTEVPRP